MATLADAILDAGLDILDTNADQINICSAEPANWAGISAVDLGDDTCTTASPVNGDTSGRKVVVTPTGGATVDETGTANYWALSNGTDTLYATGGVTGTPTVTSGNTFTLAAFDIEIQDPS